MLDAIGKPRGQHSKANSFESLGCRGDLRDNVSALAVVFEHFFDAANLSLDAIEARHQL